MAKSAKVTKKAAKKAAAKRGKPGKTVAARNKASLAKAKRAINGRAAKGKTVDRAGKTKDKTALANRSRIKGPNYALKSKALGGGRGYSSRIGPTRRATQQGSGPF